MRKQESHSETPPVGYLDYLQWHQGKTSRWSWLAIRSNLETVEGFYRGLGWTIGERALKLDQAPEVITPVYALLQPVGVVYEWILVTYPWGKTDRDEIATQAKLAAKQLTTKTFWTTTIDNEITYELLDWGDRAEYAQLSNTFTFESQLRNQPGENLLDGELIEGFPKFQFLIDEILVDLFIYLLPCIVVKTDTGFGYWESPDTKVSLAQAKVLHPPTN